MELHEPAPLVSFCTKAWRRFVKLLGRLAKNNTFRRGYAISAVVLLLASVIFWAILGARLQGRNADQLSDPYLFSSWATFHGATFPGSHTFLLKWPIFALLGVLGVSSLNLLIATVAVVVATLATLVCIIYKIDRRPLVFGTVCLGIALALLLIPAQPYPGGLLPINMAMLTTRNLEYAVYLGVLVMFIRARKLRSWSFVAGVGLLIILGASDKLFLSLSAGGALLALIVYALVSNWNLTAFAARWLAGSITAAVGAVALLFLISASHLTHLANSAAATPYGVIHSGTSGILGVAYSVLGFVTNAGANPVYYNHVLRELPGDIVGSLWSFSILAYMGAFAGFLYAVYLVWRLVRPGFRSAPRSSKVSNANLLALSLIWSTVAAFGVFIATNHYYAVDARYLTVGFLALVVTVSVSLRKLRWQWPEDLLLIACSLVVAIALAVFTSLHISSQQNQALDGVSARNATIAATLEHHKVDVLVGDYWRVLPIKLATGGTQNIMPLAGCTTAGTVLTSTQWQPNLTNHSFAYLVTLDGSLTDFPNCSLPDITAKYGRPNATQIISGTLAKPTEALLFYDQGSHAAQLAQYKNEQTPILPVGLADIPDTDCDQPTIMNVVAHQDDDLLFLSPDLLHEIQSGKCVRTVFLTAGDSGNGKFYWLNRQLGSEAAYSAMLGIKTVWDQQTVKLASNEYVTIATPRGNSKVSLVFFNLPDGDLWGQGFESTGYQSLEKLESNKISTIRTVDDQSSYSSAQLVTALSLLMYTYQPAEIHTQSDVPSSQYPDHSDHVVTGKYAAVAANQYDMQHFGGALSIPVVRYIGYPVRDQPSNITGTDLDQKEATFFAYAQLDGGVCQSLEECAQTPTYGSYLSRQYTEDSAQQ